MRFKEDSIHKVNEKEINLSGLTVGRVSPQMIRHLVNNPMSPTELEKIINRTPTKKE